MVLNILENIKRLICVKCIVVSRVSVTSVILHSEGRKNDHVDGDYTYSWYDSSFRL